MSQFNQKIMKKLLSLFLVLILGISLTACSINVDWGDDEDEDDGPVTPDPIVVDDDDGDDFIEEPYNDVDIWGRQFEGALEEGKAVEYIALTVEKQGLQAGDQYIARCIAKGEEWSAWNVIPDPGEGFPEPMGETLQLALKKPKDADAYLCAAAIRTSSDEVVAEGKIETIQALPQQAEDPDVAYDGPNFITLNTPENDAVTHEEPISFQGVVSPNTEKIVVMMTTELDGPMDRYTLQDFETGDETFSYRAKRDWNNLAVGTNDYQFTAHHDDGTKSSANLSIYFTDGTAEMGKPVIYLYPEESTEVYVNVEPVDGISISDPEIGKGWNVLASPEGVIYNEADYKTYPYLFWEGFAADFETPEEGFVIAKNEVNNFFDEKLSYMGLNEKEIADFKEFWVPLLANDPYYFITFISQADFEAYAPLTVSPTPDSVIRVFFDYRGLNAPVEVVEQELGQGLRDGFTVIEWGGRLYR
jgi:hypothetical protein